MRKPIVLWMTLFIILALTACSAGIAVVSGSSTGESSSGTTVQTSSVSAATASSTSAAGTIVDAGADNSQTHEDAADIVYDEAAVIPISLNGSSASADGTGVKVAGSQVTITSAGTYRLSGSLSDGQIVVNSVSKGVVRLILDGVDVHNSAGAAIQVIDADKVVILLAEGTENTLSDGESYIGGSAGADEPNAAVFSMADLTIAGSGALSVTGNYQDGISSKDGLIIASGSITVKAVDDGVRGKDYLVVKDGILTVDAQGDGLKADSEVDAALGFISVAGGTIVVNAGGDAIAAQTDVIITGGEFMLTTGSGSSSRADTSSSLKGIKGVVSVLIEGGSFTIDAADDAIHSNGSVTIQNGTFQLASADDGIHPTRA